VAHQATERKGTKVNAPISPSELWRARLFTPNYRIGEAARYTDLASQTVARWHRPSNRPGLLSPKEKGAALSYLQLIELAVVAACKEAGMKLADIRAARAYFAGAYETDYPFATLRLVTDGVDLAVKAGAELLIGNRGGQLAWKRIIGARFKEFEYDEQGFATRWHVAGKASPIVIDPRVRFGAPHVAGVATWTLKDRWETGESAPEIAEDFDLKVKDVLKALAFEGVDTSEQRPPWSH
jgi:uncharacterized protein (DUF433 family)